MPGQDHPRFGQVGGTPQTDVAVCTACHHQASFFVVIKTRYALDHNDENLKSIFFRKFRIDLPGQYEE